MTLRSILLGAVAATAFSGAASAANFGGWYVSLEGGANWVSDSDYVANVTPATATYSTGWAALATVGYAFGGNWRAEFEAGYRDNDIDAITPVVNIVGNSGSLTESTLMANVLYDIRLGDKLSLSLGAGAGMDFAELDLVGTLYNASDDDWNFAYQGIAGLNYAIGGRTTAFVNYRYLTVSSPNYDLTAKLGPLVDSDDYQKHTVTLGLRYALGSPQVMMDAPPAEPSAPPVAEPSGPSRQFIVFFGFNKYNLTSAALRVISEAVIAAKETGSATVVITGHTDTVGSPEFNQRLSMRRSNAVKAEMSRQGVSASNINTNGKGENELLVQTTDNVKEPQNRRATIDLN